ncbi:MAG: alanine racemase [Clostridia bacterium]|nr:alanine racemase [Clostridia bacterium]
MNVNHMRTWAEINMDALAHNFEILKTTAKGKICAVIKADAYGHGAEALALKYEKLGADFLAVSNIEEAIQIRRKGVKLPVLILGYTPAACAKTLADNNISQCVYSLAYVRELSAEAVKAGVTVKMHIKIDTGMSRLGFFCQDIERDYSVSDEIAEACALPGLYPEGIFTHFAVSDEGEAGKAFTTQQFETFMDLIDDLESYDVTFEYHHCANSAGIDDHKNTHLDMVRAGIILYGLEPSGAMRNVKDYHPVLSLKSVVSHVKTIPAGATVSYGRTFTADRDYHIATVPIGYADGYLRRFAENGACMLLRGRRCPIIGRVCMDQLMIDLGDMKDVKIGEIVTVIGNDGDECITANELAELAGTINYEIICGIGARVPRIYMENNKEVYVLDYICPEE